MKLYRIVVCSNAETLLPFNLSSDYSVEFEDLIIDAIETIVRTQDNDERMYIDTDDSFHKWNGGKFSNQRGAWGWNAGTNFVVCETDAPKYVIEKCEKIDAMIRSAIDSAVEKIKELESVDNE